MSFEITNPDAPRHSQRTARADTLEAAFEAASSLAITFECDVLITDTSTDNPGPVARIVWEES